MAITRRETTRGPRFDVEWRLPDRSKRRKSFKTEREARIFEASILTRSAAGELVDPRAGHATLASVYQSWIASRPDLSPKVRRGYEDSGCELVPSSVRGRSRRSTISRSRSGSTR
jgi:hypothetical protein